MEREGKRKKAEYLEVTKNNEDGYLSEDWKRQMDQRKKLML